MAALLFYGIIFGIGLSAIDVIALTTTVRWFTKSRGMMTGIVKVGTGAGQFSIPLLVSILITIYGWRQTYLLMGCATLLILFAIAQVLKRDPGWQKATPPSSGKFVGCQVQVSDANFTADEAVRTLQFWILCITNFLLVFCLMTIVVHIVPHGRDIGLSVSNAAAALSIIGATSMLGRFGSGFAIDRVGSKRIIMLWIIVLIGGLCWLQIADSLWRLYVFSCIYGLAHGGFFTAIPPIVAEYFGTKANGTILGILLFFWHHRWCNRTNCRRISIRYVEHLHFNV